ncbi:Protein FAM50A [Serendipita indica DSM 11827]|nr:Protein FAM50A [Serendipita indica DSM 11827]
MSGRNVDQGEMRRQALEKQRREMLEEFERQKQALVNETEKARPTASRFVGQNDTMADSLVKSTVGLVQLDEFTQKRKDLEEAKAREAARTNELKEEKRVKKRKKVVKSKLSFAGDDEENEDDEGEQDAEEPPSKKAKKVAKNPTVDTSFLPDREREQKEREMREALRQEWLRKQEEIKAEEVEVVYSYWDGSGHRKSVKVKKGDKISTFLEKARQQFPELRGVNVDNLMYIKEDLIIPHHYTFYDFIVNKARGKSGPLFNFDVHDDVRLLADATLEKDESHAGKMQYLRNGDSDRLPYLQCGTREQKRLYDIPSGIKWYEETTSSVHLHSNHRNGLQEHCRRRGKGKAGRSLIQALLSSKLADFTVTALVRKSSDLQEPALMYTKSLWLLKGQDAVVLVFTANQELYPTTKAILEAAIEAGVKRIIPSEFGCDELPMTDGLWMPKRMVNQMIDDAAKKNQITYTAIRNGPWFELAFELILGFNLKAKTVLFYDNGDRKFHTTTVASVCQAIISLLAHPDKFVNQIVHIHDFFVTQRELLDLVEQETGSKFETSTVDAEALAARAVEGLQRGEFTQDNVLGAIRTSIFREEGNARWDVNDDSAELGLGGVSLVEEIRKLISKA